MKYAVELKNISKRYKVYYSKPTMASSLFFKKSAADIWALKNINLKIKKGQRVGILGPNGSGKTTLMRVISGISVPTKGEVKVNGKIGTLMNIEAGFHPYLTGGENLLVNSVFFGMTKSEVEKNTMK